MIPGILAFLTHSSDPQRSNAELSRTIVLVLLFLILAAAGFVIARYAVSRCLQRLFKLHISAPSRKRVGIALAVVCVYAAVMPYAFLIEPDWVRVSRVTLNTSDLKEGQEFKIAQISDIHTDVDSDRRMSRALAILRREKPDIIVMTGDYANDFYPTTTAKFNSFIISLRKVAPVVAVAGNWDSKPFLPMLEKAGFDVLENQNKIIVLRSVPVHITGMDYTRYDLIPRMLDEDKRKFQLVLSHTPQMFEHAADFGADLYLCGHTHGGQVRLPVYGTLCPTYELIGKYQAGIYKRQDTTMYINRGLGMEGGGPGIRFWCWPEVTVIRVKGTGTSKGKI